jgi:hypothetical protein
VTYLKKNPLLSLAVLYFFTARLTVNYVTDFAEPQTAIIPMQGVSGFTEINRNVRGHWMG